MKGTKISAEERVRMAIISGFEKRILEETEKRKPTDRHISLNEVTSMPTYELASLALSRNAVEEVIKTMEIMRKRYIKKENVEDQVLGLFDCLEAEAYGYVALITRNMNHREKFYKLAIKYFENATERGYVQAELEKSELQLKMGKRAVARFSALSASNSDEQYAYIGECYYSFKELAESAVRVVEGKRPLISDKKDYDDAQIYYDLGKEKSTRCLVCSALFDVIDGDREKAINILRKALPQLENEIEEKEKIMFKKDYESIMQVIDSVKKGILKTNKR